MTPSPPDRGMGVPPAAAVVAVVTREAADELGLEPGVLAVASVKSTSVTLSCMP